MYNHKLRSILLLALAVMPLASFANTTGVEAINFSRFSINMQQNGKANDSFNLTLVRGTYSFGTQLSVQNKQDLINSGITTIIQPSYGNPPFSGKLYIFPSATTPSGSYYITVQGVSQNVSINTTNILVYIGIPSTTAPATTMTTQTTTENTTSTSTSTIFTTTMESSVTTTVSQSQQQGQQGQRGAASGNANSSMYLELGVLAAVIVIIIVLFIRRMRGGSVAVQQIPPAPDIPPSQ